MYESLIICLGQEIDHISRFVILKKISDIRVGLDFGREIPMCDSLRLSCYEKFGLVSRCTTLQYESDRQSCNGI